MTLTVTHAFVSGLADDPVQAAEGEVLPSHWNATHTVTGVALQVATGNINLFVNGGTGSDSNDGSSAHPFATIQHAVNVALTFDYAGQFYPTINVSNGTYSELLTIGPCFNIGTFSQFTSTGPMILGNVSVPTNCIIAPNDSSSFAGGFNPDAVLFRSGAEWFFAGFSIVADPNADGITNTGFALLHVADKSAIQLGPVDLNLGSANNNYAGTIVVDDYSIIYNDFVHTGDWTFHSTGGNPFIAAAWSRRVSNLFTPTGNFVFNTAINLRGAAFFQANINATNAAVAAGIFVNPGNVTNGTPLVLNLESVALPGQDPASFTMPGGSFDPTQIDGSSTIDGNFYTHQYAGSPVDESTIYRGSWQIHKDTNQSTATRGLALWADDAGSLFPLTPPVTTFANLPGTPLVGMRAVITDGLAGNCADGSCTTWGTHVTGGTGALNLLIWYNGTNWTLTGK